MRIVCVSDTHGRHQFSEVPAGDILIHAGDVTLHGSLANAEEFNSWLGTLPHKHKIVIAGNHDFCFQEQPEEARARITNAIYLEDSGCEIEGLKFYGSPWTLIFFNWAFMLSEVELADKWALIPNDTDVLITLLHRVYEVAPRLHVFGHIHEAAGRLDHDGITFLNASTRMGVGSGVIVDLGQ
jgi:predicted phosphohydrolase